MINISTLLIDLKVQDSSASKQITALNQELRNLSKEIKVTEGSFDTYEEKTKALNRQLEAQEKIVEATAAKKKIYAQQVEDARKRVEAAEKAHKELTSSVDATADEIAESEKNLIKMNEQLGNAERRLQNTTLELEKAEKEMSNFKRAIAEAPWKDMSESCKEISSQLGTMSSKLAPLSVALGGAFTYAGKTAMDFEATISKIKGITNAAADEVENMKDKIKELGVSTEFSASEVADGFTIMGQAGLTATEIIESSSTALDLATVSSGDMSVATDVLVNALRGFNITASESARVGDVLAATATNSNTNVQELGEAFKNVAPAAAAAGFTIEDTSMTLGLLANAGISASDAGTKLRIMMQRLATDTSGAATLVKELGTEVTYADGSFNSWSNIISGLRESFKTLTAEQQLNYAKTIAGSQAASAFLAIINASDEDFAKMTNAISEANGSLDTMASAFRDNTKGTLDEFTSKLEGLGIQIGEILLPIFNDLLTYLGDCVDWFAQLDGETQETIVTVGLLVFALSPLLGLFSSLFGILGSITGAIGAFTGAIAGGAGLTAALTAALGPVGLIVLAFGAAAAVGVAAAGAMKSVDDAFATTTETLTNNAVYGDINQLVQAMKNSYDDLNVAIGQTGREFLELYDTGLQLAEQFSIGMGGEDLELTNALLTNAEDRKNKLLEKEQSQFENQIALLEQYANSVAEGDRENALSEIERLRKKHEERVKEIEVNAVAEQTMIESKEAQITSIMENNNVSREVATAQYQQQLQDLIEKGYTSVTGIVTTNEETINGIVERANLNKNNLTTDYLAKEIQNINTSLDEQERAINEGYNAQVLELSKMASTVDEESRGMYQQMLDNLNDSKTKQLEEVNTLRTESVQTLYDLGSEVGIEAERITNKLNDGLDTKDAQQEIKDIESLWKQLEKLKDVKKSFTVDVKTSGNVAAARAAGFSGFSLQSIDIPSVVTYGADEPTTINDLANSNISNFATDNSRTSSVVNNIAKAVTASANTNDSRTELLLSSLINELKNSQQEKPNININIEKVSNDVDIYEMIDIIDKELEKRKIRANSMRGGGNIVR